VSGRRAMPVAMSGGPRLTTWVEVTFMLQDLAALAPPAIVCVAFLVGAGVIVRRELAPKRRARAQAGAAADEGAHEHADREQGRS
jgi:hypothetical protein